MTDTLPKTQSLTPRRRGAPRGNRNALKHGIYSRQFKSKEVTDQDELSTVSLSNEIFALRVFIRRFVEANAEVTDGPQVTLVLHELSLALHTLTRLVRTQALVNKDGDFEEKRTLRQAFAQIAEDLNLSV